MDNFTIETAQNISIHQNVAYLSTRIGAFILDVLVQLFYGIVITFIIGLIGEKSAIESLSMLSLLYLPIFFYSLIFESLMDGQTLGKKVTQIKVVKLDGSKPTFGSYLIRWVLRVIDISFAGGSVAILTILLNGKGQRLGDIAAGTTLISLKKRITLNNTIAADLQEGYTPTYPQVTLLTDKDIHTIKSLYNDAKSKRNHNVILKLHDKVIGLTGITTKEKPIKFIDTILKDYQYYMQNAS